MKSRVVFRRSGSTPLAIYSHDIRSYIAMVHSYYDLTLRCDIKYNQKQLNYLMKLVYNLNRKFYNRKD